MTSRKPILLLLLPILLLVLSSCASTSLVHVWKDEAYNDTIKRVLVIGVTKKELYKRSFEDEFVRQFKEQGIDAVAAFRVLPIKKKLDKKEIRAKVEELGIDAVLVTRLVDKKTVETYFPPRIERVYRGPYYGPRHHHNLHGYYERSYDIVTVPGYTLVEKFIILETNIYDAETEEIIWAVSTETSLGEPSNKLIESLIELLVANLKEHQML
ncbi:MAG: hypothetical protein IME99_10230 [Proteobacteria bacterium]|nr:hypothetical protein [Pseudomonadota bacterium]